MRIRCEVLAVETRGEKMIVRYQAQRPGAAFWRDMLKGTLELDVDPKTERTYHLGRTFFMELRPE